MQVAHWQENRRREERQPTPGRVTWRRIADGLGCWAWLSDGSPSSISFVTASRFQPVLDDRIEIVDTARSFRVMRMESYDLDLTFVACAVEEEPLSPPAESESALN